MPCRDYESDSYSSPREVQDLKARADMLARIACRLMSLVEDAAETPEIKALHEAILQDGETAKWHKLHRAADRLARERAEREAAKIAKIEANKASGIAKMSAEELKLFGIKTESKPRVRKNNDARDFIRSMKAL